MSGGDASGGAPQGNYSTKFLETRKRKLVWHVGITHQSEERESTMGPTVHLLMLVLCNAS